MTSSSRSKSSFFNNFSVETVRSYATLGIFLLMVLAASLWSEAFLTERNIMNVVTYSATVTS